MFIKEVIYLFQNDLGRCFESLKASAGIHNKSYGSQPRLGLETFLFRTASPGG